jgi:hypothetical protein
MSKGIDISIQEVKYRLEQIMQELDPDFIVFGRSFRNKREKDKTSVLNPEMYIGAKEYSKDLIYNDKVSGHCFFYHDSDIDIQNDHSGSTDLSIYFAVNLSKLYPAITTERATEYLHESIMQAVIQSGIKVSKIGTGYESWEKFKLSNSKQNMHPRYLCRFDLENVYVPVISDINCY